MSPKLRDGIYVALFLLNLGLGVASEMHYSSHQVAFYIAFASSIVAAMLQKFRSQVPVQEQLSLPLPPDGGVK